MNDPTIGADVCPVNSCLFVDLGGQARFLVIPSDPF